MSATVRRLTRPFNALTLLLAAVVALAILSFVVAVVLINSGDHSTGTTTVTPMP